MKKILMIIGLMSMFAIGYVIGKNNSSTLPLHELEIPSNFIEPCLLVYDQNSDVLKSKVSLSNKGKEYINTNLFVNDYLIEVKIINNETEEELFSSEQIEWNGKSNINIDIPVNSSIINDQELNSKLQLELKEMIKGNEHHLVYSIELSPRSNALNVCRYVGMLNKSN